MAISAPAGTAVEASPFRLPAAVVPVPHSFSARVHPRPEAQAGMQVLQLGSTTCCNTQQPAYLSDLPFALSCNTARLVPQPLAAGATTTVLPDTAN